MFTALLHDKAFICFADSLDQKNFFKIYTMTAMLSARQDYCENSEKFH